MRWFIPLFFFVFLLMHLYAYLRLIRASVKSLYLKRFLLVLFAVGFFSPLVWRYADLHWHPVLAYWLALSGLLWIGFLFYMVVFGLFTDLYLLFVFLSKSLLGINPLPTPSRRAVLSFVLALSLSLSAYGYYETLNLRVERFSLHSEKLKRRVKVLHISDLHLGPVMGMDKVRAVLEVYEREKPDLVVSTGDLVDGNMRNKLYLAEALASMKPPLGKYAVLGNHEYYRGVEQALEFTKRAGFKVLRGRALYLPEPNMSLVGIDDDDCRFFEACEGSLSDEEVLTQARRDSFILYLKHKPRLEGSSEKLFDLMLSGHTHGGVYYPVGRFILTHLFISDRGLHRLGSSYIYISKGVGMGGPPIRLFSPPDVAIIELLPSDRHR